MPSFSGADVATTMRAQAEVIELCLYAGDELIPGMTYSDLLYDVGDWMQRNVMLASFSSPPRSYIRPEYREGLKEWVYERCRRFSGEAELTRLEVHYVKVTWDLSQSPSAIINEELMDNYVINFD